MYTIKLQRYSKGKPCSTRYRFSIRLFAKYFALGYKAALLDTNNPEYLISIFNGNDRIYNDVDIFKEIDWIVKGVKNSLYGQLVDSEYSQLLNANKVEKNSLYGEMHDNETK